MACPSIKSNNIACIVLDIALAFIDYRGILDFIFIKPSPFNLQFFYIIFPIVV
jgi:hypothetical protein